MKKNLLICLACVATLLMTSCWEEPGYSYTSTFSRVVTIDRNAQPLKFVADCTGEVFKPGNLTMDEQLSLYGLEGADRAIVSMELAVENYNQTLTFKSGSPVKVNPVTTAPLAEGGKYGPDGAPDRRWWKRRRRSPCGSPLPWRCRPYCRSDNA